MAINKSLAAKAHKAESTSEGIRILLQDGVSVADAAKEMDVKYAFAYGVARRADKAGLIKLADVAAPREAKAKAPAKKAPAKAKAAPAAKAKAPARSTKRPAKKAAAKSK